MIGGRVIDVRHQRCKKCVQLDNIIAFEHISVAMTGYAPDMGCYFKLENGIEECGGGVEETQFNYC